MYRDRRMFIRKTQKISLLLATSALTLTIGGGPARAGSDEDARIARLEAAVAALQSQVRAQGDLAAENAVLKKELAKLQARDDAAPTRTATIERLANPPFTSVPSPASANNQPVVASTFSGGEPGIATADGRFSLNLYALVQLDAALYDQTAPGPISTDLRRTGPALGYSAANVDNGHARDLKNGDDFRRARIGFSGTAFGDFQYRVLADFGGSGVENAGQLYEAWGQYNGLRPLRLRIGAFAPQEGLADQDSAAAQPFLERPISADIARNFEGGDTRTAAQAFAYGDRYLASLAVTGRAVGVSSSAGTGVPQTYGDQLGYAARVAGTPLRGDGWLVHVGGHAQYIARPADTSGPPASGASPLSRYTVSLGDQPELRVDGTKLINTGNIDARHAAEVGAEAAAQYRSFLIQSEYDHFDIARAAPGVSNPTFNGWYVEASWVVTGEARKYNTANAAFDAPPVRHALGSGGIGAVELALRYSTMNLNYDAGALGSAPSPSTIRGGKLDIYSAALNWYPNPYIRLALEGQHVELDRLSPDAATYVTPIGAQIGQSYNALALRSQFGF
jgi:phosphate-selective porin OprO/OprP